MKNTLSKVLLLLLFLSNSTFLFSQSASSSTEESKQDQGMLLFEKANSFFSTNIDSMEHYMLLAAQQFKQKENWEMYVSCYNSIAICSDFKGEYEQFYEYSQLALNEAEKHLKKTSKERNDAMYNLAISFSERGQYKKAIERLENIYKNEKDSKDIERIGCTLGLLGYNHLLFGDYEESLAHYNQALKMWRDTSGFIRFGNEARIYNRMGNSYFRNGLVDSAIVAYHNSIQLITRPEVGRGNVQDGMHIQFLLDLAEAYLSQENFSAALSHMNKAQTLSEGIFYHNQGLLNELFGRIHLKQKSYSLAINYFKKSKILSQKEFELYAKHRLIAEKDIWIGKTYLANGQLETALSHFQKALNGLNNDTIALDESQLPTLENLFAKNIALRALRNKARTLFLLFQQQQTPAYLKQANETYLLTTHLIQELRQNYIGESSKQNLSSEVLTIFEEAIEVAINCFEQTQDSSYLDQAFTFSESNKSIILLESINDNTAKGFAGIPADLLTEEENLRIEVSYYKKAINELQQKANFNSNDLKSLESKLFDQQKKYNRLIAKIEREYPRYFQLKYSTQLVNVKDIQNSILKPQQTLIEYFFGEKNIYIFAITKHQLNIQTIKKDKRLLEAILEVNRLISSPPSDQKLDFTRYTTQAHFLFEKLLKHSIPQNYNQLIIIPDDILNYLPFETLLTAPVKNDAINYSIANLDYLLKSQTISYAYSSTLLKGNTEKEEVEFSEDFIGFAPSFGNTLTSKERSCSRDGLSSLFCNGDEIDRINDLISGRIFHDQEANLDNFYKNSNHCKILHLATHACVDDANPLFNKIHFSNNYLSNSDLYNLQLNAKLTVLSACNTGVGQLAKGEGVMSLSRGFIHAGCPSVVMSLWSVDDCATSEIMFNFYDNLKKQTTKSEALLKAKMDFITNAKKSHQHPYYWAAFVQIGNEDAIQFSTKYPLWFFGGLGIGFLGIIYLLGRSKK